MNFDLATEREREEKRCTDAIVDKVKPLLYEGEEKKASHERVYNILRTALEQASQFPTRRLMFQ